MNTRANIDFDQLVGRNLKRLRHNAGLTQKDIGRLMGITFQQVQKYENGQNRLSAERLYRLRDHFSVPYDYFFEGIGGTSNIEMGLLNHDPDALSAALCLAAMTDKAQKEKLMKVISILADGA